MAFRSVLHRLDGGARFLRRVDVGNLHAPGASIEEGRDDPALSGFVDELVKYPVVPAVKAMVARRTGDGTWRAARAPLSTISASDEARLAGLIEGMERAAAA